MKIVNIIGGLGNQLFQYAFALGLQAEFPEEEVKINTLCFNGYPLHNGFELDSLFDIRIQKATLKDLIKVAYPWTHYKLWQIGSRILPKRQSMITDDNLSGIFSYDRIKDKSYFDGYWQSPHFFEKYRNLIIKNFNFPNIEDPQNIKAIKYIEEAPTAFIHVRRGDYVNHPKYKGICNLTYYRKAIEILKNKYSYDRFIVFSNDIDWCVANLSSLIQNNTTMYVDWNKGANSHLDIQLMSKCNAGIIANSSFSWWGGWLANSPLIIAPIKWTNDTKFKTDIIPIEWIRCSGEA